MQWPSVPTSSPPPICNKHWSTKCNIAEQKCFAWKQKSAIDSDTGLLIHLLHYWLINSFSLPKEMNETIFHQPHIPPMPPKLMHQFWTKSLVAKECTGARKSPVANWQSRAVANSTYLNITGKSSP